jgi:hypothetical protein
VTQPERKAFDDDPDMSLEDGESVWDKLVQQTSSSIPPNEPRYPGKNRRIYALMPLP